MSIRINIILLSTLLIYNAAFSQTLPALPNTQEVITCFPDTTGYTVITVGPVDRDYSDLQAAINASSLGSVLVLDAGVTFFGGFQLPDKGVGDEWIIITSDRMDLMPVQGERVQPNVITGNPDFPTQADAMPKIVTNNLSGIPGIKTQPYSHHYRFVGIEITAALNVTQSYGLINLGDGSSAQNTLNVVPHHFVIDRCYIHGHTNGTIMKFGVRLDCANAAIIDSYISDFHSIGFDAQAIAGFNGPGPFKIINNYLEASGENILFGGAAPSIPGLVPSDIEIRQNYFYKPWSWRVGHPDYAGKHWTIKNLFELKTGKRVLLDGNILENCWADLPTGQSGYAILLTIRTEGGASPQADVSDIVISNNIIRHVGAGISLSGTDGGEGNRSSRILIANNLFDDVNGPLYGDQNVFGPNDGTFLKIGEPRDVWIDHNTVFQTGPITWAYDMTDGFIYTNNITHSFISAGGYRGIYGPGQSEGNNTIAHYFPDVTDANMHFHKNVLIAGDVNKYTNYNNISDNYFPANVQAVMFVDYSNGSIDYHGYTLAEASPYKGFGTNGKDIGVNFNELDSALFETRVCPTVITRTDDLDREEIMLQLFPNPVSGVLYAHTSGYFGEFYHILDIHGKIILSGETKPNHVEINTRSMNAGIYIFHTTIDFKIINTIFIVL